MSLVAAYLKQHLPCQWQLENEHIQMVKRIAHHLKGRLPQSIVIDDLIQAGMIGLLEAAKNFDPTKGASFETYASIRIRGHMLDEVRRNDWVPRSVYKNARLIADAVKTVENRTGRDAKDAEVAKELNLPLSEFHRMLKDTTGSQIYGFEDLGVTDDMLIVDSGPNYYVNEPYKNVQKADFYHKLTTVIGGMPEKEQLVLSLYYERELNLKEIGAILNVSESRVSQIHSQAMLRVKARMAE